MTSRALQRLTARYFVGGHRPPFPDVPPRGFARSRMVPPRSRGRRLPVSLRIFRVYT